MSVDRFNDTTDEDVQKDIEQEREKKKEEKDDGGSDNSRDLFKVKDGLNVLWMMPGVETTKEPVVPLLVHYNPFHLCGRSKTTLYEGDGLDKEKDFSKCYRCISAWNKFDSLNQPDGGPAKSKFLDDMSKSKGAFQVVNLSPFFKEDDDLVIPDEEMINEWFGTFKEIACSDEVDDEELSDDIPDEVVEAAKQSPSVTFVNEDVGFDVRKKHKRKKRLMEKDPTIYPDQALLKIKRTKKKNDTFTGNNGETICKRRYDVDYIDDSLKMSDVNLSDLGLSTDGDFFASMAEKAVDIKNIDVDEESLEERAKALHDLGDDEMQEYLDSQGHSFNAEEGTTEQGLDPDDEGALDSDEEEIDVDEEELQEPEALASDADLADLEQNRE
jgi:hypothetical protein